MPKNRAISTTVIAILIAAYIATRFWRLTASCLWFDEIFSIHAAEHSWNTILTFIAQDLIHPPLFYLILKVWIGIGADSLFWLRSLPVIISVVALIPFILLFRQLKLSKLTLGICLLFLVVNGALLKYSQEVRMYSLVMCLSLFSTWLFSRYFFKGKSLIPLILINVLLVYSHYFGWFVVFTEVLAILLFQRIKIRAILVMSGVTITAFLPWAVTVFKFARAGAEVGQNIGWMQKPGVVAIIQFIFALIEPFYSAPSSIDPYSIYQITLPLFLLSVIALILFFTKWNRQNEHERQCVKLLILFPVVPVSIAFVVSWILPYSVWGTRHLIIIFASFLILLSVAITKIELKTIRTGAITLIVLFSSYAFVLATLRDAPQYSWCAWEPLTGYAKDIGPGNIYVFEDLVAYHFWYELKQDGATERKVKKIANIDGLKEDKAYFLPRGFDEVKILDIGEVNEKQLFIAFRAKIFDETKPPISSFLNRGYIIKNQLSIKAVGEDAILVYLEK
jgi:uncharacterized membrane protein